MKICPSCGKGNNDTDNFCIHCGAILTGVSPMPLVSGKKSSLANISLSFGIIGLILSCCSYLSIPCLLTAIITGSFALPDAKEKEERKKALAGLILGCITIVTVILNFVFLLPALTKELQKMIDEILKTLNE